MTTPRDPLAEKLRAALDDEPAATDEDALLARALERAMARALPAAAKPEAEAGAAPEAEAGAEPAAKPRPGVVRVLPASRGRARFVRYAVPIAAAFAASFAMAAAYVVYRAPSTPDRGTTRTLPGPATAPATGQAPRAPVATTPGELPGAPAVEAPAVSVDDLPSAPPASPPPSAGSGSAHRAPVAETTTAAELFRDANAARRAGDVAAAVDLYRSLVERHPASAEAHAARVSLGRVYLDKLGDPAHALAQFDAYLQSSTSDRSLAEEARLGRALVFQRQGRQEEERRAWQDLLDRHPDSLHAARARERLRALAGEPAPAAPPTASP